MANVVVTMRIMPTSPDVDLTAVEKAARETIASFGGSVGKVEIQPIAFGLKAVDLFLVLDEAKGGTEPLEAKLSAIKGVESAEVTDVRRAIG